MKYLLFLMENNKLTHEVFEKFIASGCTKLKGVDVAESSQDDSSGVEYIVNRGGRAAVQTLLSLETLTHEAANANAAFLVEPKLSEPTSRPLYMDPRVHVDPYALNYARVSKAVAHDPLDSDQHIEQKESSTSASANAGGINYPDGFTPDMVDATEAEYAEWTDKLMKQQIRKFSCLEAIKRHVPLKGDPLLDIRIKGRNFEI